MKNEKKNSVYELSDSELSQVVGGKQDKVDMCSVCEATTDIQTYTGNDGLKHVL